MWQVVGEAEAGQAQFLICYIISSWFVGITGKYCEKQRFETKTIKKIGLCLQARGGGSLLVTDLKLKPNKNTMQDNNMELFI